MRLRFPKSARLTRATEFATLKEKGVSHHGKYMVLSVLQQASPGEARVGLITSRRVGMAVARNRIRRRFRELVRTDRPHLTRGCWLVLVARNRAATASFENLRTEWRTLAQRSGVLKEQP